MEYGKFWLEYESAGPAQDREPARGVYFIKYEPQLRSRLAHYNQKLRDEAAIKAIGFIDGEHRKQRMRKAEIAAENIQAARLRKWLRDLPKRDFPVSKWRRELETKLMLGMEL